MDNPRPHVSAVVVAHERPVVEVYDLSGNPSAPGFQGTALARDVFDGAEDRWYGFIGEVFDRDQLGRSA